ncbi:hypothetical protein FC40_GL000576 [Ligilactobacillus hayakitensis DSM 18933 = JCM 14209]|uniref:SEC10/PgrA surface exclusion domain-containing protein n=1 Tax=Ligilactobacillus hayakitensis DSM 18933 = JCM 14209 TaxID=1423755 RepID=A0A0R1WLT2_9LACO|nr:SEC10/PgrA surface exclusion domain-containing protein [Ligilactobacillus hayakitensis]KRM18791.1 hypothetical protein FC40_GL000576 [Ligilactobacillus hayakitensis DSM 18933 = JCM 14209]
MDIERIKKDMADAHKEVQQAEKKITDIKNIIENNQNKLNENVEKVSKLKRDLDEKLDTQLKYQEKLDFYQKIKDESENFNKSLVEKDIREKNEKIKLLELKQAQINENWDKVHAETIDIQNKLEIELTNLNKATEVQKNTNDSSNIMKRELQRNEKRVDRSKKALDDSVNEIEKFENEIKQLTIDIAGKKKNIKNYRNKESQNEEVNSEALTELDQQQELLNKLKADSKEIGQKIKNLSEKLEANSAKIAAIPRIKLPEKFNKALFNNYTQGKIDGNEMGQITTEGLQLNLFQEFLDKSQLNFNFDEVDYKTEIEDIQEIKDQVVIEISAFAASLLNKVREVFELPQLSVNPESIEFTKEVVKRYNQDNWQSFNNEKNETSGKGHDIDALFELWNSENSAFRNFDSKEEVIGNGEPYLADFKDKLTLADLKYVVFQNIISMLFADSENEIGKVLTLLGFPKDEDSEYRNHLLGVSIDKYFTIHFELAYSDNQIEGSYLLPDFGCEKLNEEKVNLNNKKEQLENRLEINHQKIKDQEQILAQLEKKAALLSVEKIKNDISKMDSKKSELKKQLKKMKQHLSEQKDDWINLKGKVTLAISRYEASKAAITAADIELDAKNNEVNVLKKKLDLALANEKKVNESKELNVYLQTSLKAQILEANKELEANAKVDEKLIEINEILLKTNGQITDLTDEYNLEIVKVSEMESILDQSVQQKNSFVLELNNAKKRISNLETKIALIEAGFEE